MENIVRQIGELSPAELAAFREWFAKFDASAWDRQFEADVKAGKFDSLAEQALVPRPSDWFPNAPGRACPAPTPRRCRGEARLALAPSVTPTAREEITRSWRWWPSAASGWAWPWWTEAVRLE